MPSLILGRVIKKLIKTSKTTLLVRFPGMSCMWKLRLHSILVTATILINSDKLARLSSRHVVSKNVLDAVKPLLFTVEGPLLPDHIAILDSIMEESPAKPVLLFVSLNPSASRTLLVLHGTFSSHHEFQLLLSTLTLQNYHILFPDLPRHGSVASPKSPCSP
ncbi:hypothetical protein BKA65DRAFT_185721 [Rhexocercosporidium sp. MPI-PUGE-AT-0058]|nr:hypothetical protein BKA65DRAFT_185721 [Rhexocercosporidium sp. MPI-PUGE-AT-0058]